MPAQEQHGVPVVLPVRGHPSVTSVSGQRGALAPQFCKGLAGRGEMA